MENEIRVIRVHSKKEWKDFFELPYAVYRDEKNWVPKAPGLEKQLLDTCQNPYFLTAKMYPLLAYKNSKPVGRVCGFIDSKFTRDRDKRIGVFGFLEYDQDARVLKSLISTLENWFKKNELEAYLGPMNPSLNGEVGVLSEGFDSENYPMMNYAKKNYVEDLRRNGFEPYKEFFAYEYKQENDFPTSVVDHQKRILEEHGIKIRSINLRNLRSEMRQVQSIANESMTSHWGYVPMTDQDIDFLTHQIRLIIDSNLFLVAEFNKKVVGFLFALPNVNEYLSRCSRPVGLRHLVKLFILLKTPLRKKFIQSCRLATLGVAKEFQKIAIGPALYCEMLNRCRAHGYPTAEASWVLADNKRVNRLHCRLGAKLTKKYFVFWKDLDV